MEAPALTASAPASAPAHSRLALLRTLGSAARMAWESAPREVAGSGAILVLAATLPPAVVLMGKRIVDATFSAGAPGARGHGAATAVLLLTAAIIGQRILNTIQGNTTEVLAESIKLRAEMRFMERAHRVPIAHLDESTWHDRMARASRDLNWRPSNVTYAMAQAIASSVTLLGMLGVLLTLSPLLGVLAIASQIPPLLLQGRINRAIYTFWFQNTAHWREREYLQELVTRVQWSREVRAYGLGRHLTGRFQAIAGAQLAELRRLYSRANRSAVGASIVGGGLLGLCYGYLAWRGLGGALTPGDLTAGIGAIASIAAQIGALSGSLLLLDQHANFLSDYFWFLDQPAEPEPAPAPSLVAAPEPGDGIRFEDVGFRYASGAQAVDGVSLHIRPGELIALVGENGAGKTTLVKLLLKFYEPTSGRITWDGADLHDLPPAAVRSRIGVLFQDYGQFQLSVRENVEFGRPDVPATDDEISAALKRARARFVDGLQRGLDAKVGRLFEGGHDLSGGEWQRLALARLLHRDADVWILDEPTSALDPEAEAAIFAELRQLLRSRIGIVISHRFSTVRIADRIAVVDGGRLVEVGSHDELVERGGVYAHLFELQAAGYR